MRITIEVVFLLFVILFLFSITRFIFKPYSVSAARNIYYPHTCLGGWKNTALAAGVASIEEGADGSSFSSSNSAMLASDVSAPIYCARFDPEVRDAPPYSVSISFNWTMKTPDSVTAEDEATDTTPSLGATTFTVSTSTADTVIIPALSSSTAGDADTGLILIQTDSDASSAPSSEPVPQKPAKEETPAQPQTPAKPETPAPAPSAPVDAPATAPSDTQSSIYRSILAFFAKTAYADETMQNSDFMRVSYSLDGTDWKTVGTVNAGNWKGYSFQLPNATWDDLQNLQVKLEPLESVNGHPVIYLDSVSLHVEDSPTITETVSDKLSDVGDAAKNAFDIVSDLTDAALNIITPGQDQESPVQTQVSQQSAPAAVPSTPTLHVEKKLAFSINGLSIPAKRKLAWYSDEDRAKVKEVSLPDPQVTIADNGLSISVSGSCTEKYYVVALFKNADDYISNPRNAAMNYAGECANGRFSYDFNLLSDSLPDGSYYLLTADQAATGPWVPSSQIIPLSITHREIDVKN